MKTLIERMEVRYSWPGLILDDKNFITYGLALL